MSGIRSSITLQDDFTEVLYRIIDSVNLGLSAMEDLYRDMESPVNTASIEGARDSLAQATIAAQGLSEALQGLGSVPAPAAPAQPTWQADNLDVFSNTGIERLEQEIQSANTMMRTLNETQRQIGITAAQTDLFPDAALSDMSNMQVRLQAVQQRIQQIESNPLNMGTDTANSELEQLRSQLNRAVQEQETLNRAVQNMDIEEANQAYLRLSRTISGAERYIRDNISEQEQFNAVVEQGTQETNRLIDTLKGAVTAYAGMQAVERLVDMSDEMSSTNARLFLLVDDGGSVAELEDKVMASAMRSRAVYSDVADSVAKLGSNAGEIFDDSADQIIGFAELVNKQFVISGASAAEASNAMLQLTQAMSSGVLQGDELRSIFEQSPQLIQRIADYMDIPIGQVRTLASEGQITADIVKNAMFAAADDINEKFNEMPMTWGQVFTLLSNVALIALQPILNGISWLANNISIIGPLVLGLAGAFTVFLIAANWANIAAAAMAAWTAVQAAFNAVMAANPIFLIVMGIMLLIGIIYAAVAAYNKFANSTISATGIICGVIASAGAFILNTVMGVVDAAIQAVFTIFAEPFVGIIEWILNVANGGFNSFGDAVANLVGNIISWFLSLGQVVTKIIDAIFGTDWTGGLNALKSKVIAWGKNDKAITLDRNVPTLNHRISYGSAWDAGYDFGQGIANTVSDALGIGDIIGGMDTGLLGNLDDLTNALNNSDLADTSGRTAGSSADTADNTSDISKALDITNEDLKYLRDIAEREVVNRYTTASITVNMTNHNNVSSDMDLDGMTEYLRARIEEQMDAAAEGVH